MKDLHALSAEFASPGQVEAIYLRPARGQPVQPVSTCEAVADRGLLGDRTAAGRGGSRRQVTLLQAEHLPVLAALLRRAEVDAALLRRNL